MSLCPIKSSAKLFRIIAVTMLVSLIGTMIGPLPNAQAVDFSLPSPGAMVALSPRFNPPILKGIKVHPDNPFRFEFIMDVGAVINRQNKRAINNRPYNEEAKRLIKYFLASLTIPEKDLWVNLSPYEKDRIIPNAFGKTEMGRDLLAEDYMLKQITASLIYPEGETGRKFWKKIYQEAAQRFHTTNIPVNTFNKVWIVPRKAVVYENAKVGTAYVVEAKLKVMLEEDYLAFSHSVIAKSEARKQSLFMNKEIAALPTVARNDTITLGSQIIREIVIPELTKEVNEGSNFAQLRQVYNSLILATWYKKKIKDSILARVYENRNKVAGVKYAKSVILSPRLKHSEVNSERDLKIPYDPSSSTQNDVELIYHRYLQAFKKGAYNYIKEEQDLLTRQRIPRKYFSGGVNMAQLTNLVNPAMVITHHIDPSLTANDDDSIVKANVLPIDHAQLTSEEIRQDMRAKFAQRYSSDKFRKLIELRRQYYDLSNEYRRLNPVAGNARIDNLTRDKNRISYDLENLQRARERKLNQMESLKGNMQSKIWVFRMIAKGWSMVSPFKSVFQTITEQINEIDRKIREKENEKKFLEGEIAQIEEILLGESSANSVAYF